jgi:acyl carrier protein
LLSGPMADELDITELFLDLEEELGVKLPDAEAEGVDMVGELWGLVERKIAARDSADNHRAHRG